MARRNYRAEARRRNQLARQRGFRNYWAQRKGSRYPRSGKELGRLPEAAREARTDALRVIDRADHDDIAVEEAAHRLGIRRSVIDWFAGDALGSTRHRKTYVTETDELLRLRPLLVDGTATFVETKDRRKAREAEHVFDVQWRYIHGRATRQELDRLPRTFMGRRVVRDPEELVEIGRRGELTDIPDAYREVLG